MTDPLFQRSAVGDLYYYHNDHLGTPQQMIDSSGNIIWAADYSAFGEAHVTINVAENSLRFPGQYFDVETGLHQNYFRDYDPKNGRYIESDPIGIEGGMNFYLYSNSNPLRTFDSYGLKQQSESMLSPPSQKEVACKMLEMILAAIKDDKHAAREERNSYQKVLKRAHEKKQIECAKNNPCDVEARLKCQQIASDRYKDMSVAIDQMYRDKIEEIDNRYSSQLESFSILCTSTDDIYEDVTAGPIYEERNIFEDLKDTD